MDTIENYAMNLLALGIILRERTSGEDEALKRLLTEIKNGGKPANYCLINEVLNIRSNELYMLKSEIDSLIERVNSRAIADDLSALRDKLFELTIDLMCLQKDFRNYLFCPAMNQPEVTSK